VPEQVILSTMLVADGRVVRGGDEEELKSEREHFVQG